jgi:hypothetical protein
MERAKHWTHANRLERAAVVVACAIQPFESFVLFTQRCVDSGYFFFWQILGRRDFFKFFKNLARLGLPANSRIGNRQPGLRSSGHFLRFFEQRNRFVVHSFLAVGVGNNWSLVNVIWIELQCPLSLRDCLVVLTP